MFDIGFWELVLIAVIGLVVLGPERLPVAVRTVAHWVKTIRAMAASVQNELNQELKLQEMQNNLKKAEKMDLKDLSPELDASLRELKDAADSVQRPYAPPIDHTQSVVSAHPNGTSPAELAEQAEEEHEADDQHPVHLAEGLPISTLTPADPIVVEPVHTVQPPTVEQSLKREQP
ncbi:MAG: Sec-independent protein translocase protein TatB [Plesiomonas sp.]|uniref:Sec-independent protein translocase protein TatB n=1 Tax=Plesiomonas sp. TaxID=2486279 RepID=UPI003F4198F1